MGASEVLVATGPGGQEGSLTAVGTETWREIPELKGAREKPAQLLPSAGVL